MVERFTKGIKDWYLFIKIPDRVVYDKKKLLMPCSFVGFYYEFSQNGKDRFDS